MVLQDATVLVMDLSREARGEIGGEWLPPLKRGEVYINSRLAQTLGGAPVTVGTTLYGRIPLKSTPLPRLAEAKGLGAVPNRASVAIPAYTVKAVFSSAQGKLFNWDGFEASCLLHSFFQTGIS